MTLNVTYQKTKQSGKLVHWRWEGILLLWGVSDNFVVEMATHTPRPKLLCCWEQAGQLRRVKPDWTSLPGIPLGWCTGGKSLDSSLWSEAQQAVTIPCTSLSSTSPGGVNHNPGTSPQLTTNHVNRSDPQIKLAALLCWSAVCWLS